MSNWKTALSQSLIDAQAAATRQETHRKTVETLESLIGNAYNSGDATMERMYRQMLDIYEREAYDL